MRIVLIWMALILTGPAEKKLSIEAFWLGKVRFFEEIRPEYGEEPMTRRAPEVSVGESRFFDEGDVLWDLKAHYEAEGISAEWLVYNETTGYLVAKAEEHALGALELRHFPWDHPKNMILEFALFEVVDSRSHWVDWSKHWQGAGKKLLFEEQIRCRSGETSEQSFASGGGFAVHVDCQQVLWGDLSAVDVRLRLEVEGDAKSFTQAIALSLPLGKEQFFEWGGLGEGKTWVAKITPTARLVGGPSLSEWHLGKELTIGVLEKSPFRWGFQRLRPDGEHQLVMWRVYDGFIDDIALDEEDPFAPDGGEKEPKYPVLTPREVPKALRTYFPREQWRDVSQAFEDSGLEFSNGDAAYLGSLNEIVVVRHRDEGQLDLVDQILIVMDGDPPSSIRLHAALLCDREGKRNLVAEIGQACPPGELVESSWKSDGKDWKLETQGTLGAGGQFVDARIYSAYEQEGVKQELNTGFTYAPGHPKEFVLHKTAEESWILRLEIVRVDSAGETFEDWQP
ncbi:hypothetical protein AAFN60_00375 [Roseibacillus persicicus]|uniref:hypothetical protein n=1 Tax=Roseibacillus persicicus TaxID=454148 RepID=UPI00398BA671